MSEQTTPTPPRRRRSVLAALLAVAALAVAVPASGAFAGADHAGTAPSNGHERTAPVQNRDGGRHGNCPGHHGSPSSTGPSGDQSQSGDTGNSAV